MSDPYAPSYIIYANGRRLTSEEAVDIMEIRIIDRLDGPSKFSIKVADPEKKWLDSEELYNGITKKVIAHYASQTVRTRHQK